MCMESGERGSEGERDGAGGWDEEQEVVSERKRGGYMQGQREVKIQTKKVEDL